MPRLLPDDAPPERIGGLLGGKWTAGSAAASSRRSTPAPPSRRVEVRSASHGEVAKQSHVRGVRYRLGPRESQPRRWIGGGRMHLLGEIPHQTRATGEVAAPPLGVTEGFENVG
jgi:hypothetical protein